MKNDHKGSRLSKKKPAKSHNKFQNGKCIPFRQIDEWDTALPIPHLPPSTAALFVAVLAVCCYGRSITGGFVFDDSEAVESNNDVQPNSDLLGLFHHDFWGGSITSKESHKSYRPLTILTYRWNYYLVGGLHPLVFHATNIILHVANSVLSLFMFGSLMGDGTLGLNQNTILASPRASLLCAILFTIHPIHTENVAAIVGRADLLCALFFFLSFLCYVVACKEETRSSKHNICVVLCVLSCCVSMLCKEQGITVLGVCSIYDIFYCGDLSLNILLKCMWSSSPLHLLKCHTNNFKSILVRHAILIVTGTILLGCRYTIMGSSAPQFQPVDNPASFINNTLCRVLNYNYIFALNGWLLLHPMWLCFDWSMGCIPLINSLTDPRILVVVSFWITFLKLIYLCAITHNHQTRVLAMAISTVIVPFLPASNIFFQVGFVIAERNLYIPSMGFIMLVVMGIHLLSNNCRSQGRLLIQVSLLFLVSSHILKCIHRCQEWSVEEKLFKAGLNVCPLNAKIHYNIAKAATDSGNVEVALAYYRTAIRLHPEYDHALNNLGNLLKADNNLMEAESLLEKAVSINPKFAAAWMNLGIVQAGLEKYSEAKRSYEEALTHRRKYPDCYFNLGNLVLYAHASELFTHVR